MFVAGVGIDGENIRGASGIDLEYIVWFVGNLLLVINQAILYIKGYKSSIKELLDLYKSEEVMEVIEKYNKDLGVIVY